MGFALCSAGRTFQCWVHKPDTGTGMLQLWLAALRMGNKAFLISDIREEEDATALASQCLGDVRVGSISFHSIGQALASCHDYVRRDSGRSHYPRSS